MFKKKILIKGPVLSRSGYGEQARCILKALRSREDLFDIHLMNIPWGRTGHQSEVTEETEYIREGIQKTAMYIQEMQQNNNQVAFDVSVQVTIPNEFEKIAPIYIGS